MDYTGVSGPSTANLALSVMPPGSSERARAIHARRDALSPPSS